MKNQASRDDANQATVPKILYDLDDIADNVATNKWHDATENNLHDDGYAYKYESKIKDLL